MFEYCIHGVASIILRQINGEKHIIIQKRKKGSDSFESGLIEIPCAKVKQQESVFECLRKKVLVETGLKITKIFGEHSYETVNFNNYKVINYVPFFSSQNILDNYPIVIDTFICEAEGEPIIESKDAKDIQWISLRDLKCLFQENETLFYPMIVKSLKRFIDIELKQKDNVI